MVEEVDYKNEQIKTLKEYIRLLEKVSGRWTGLGLSASERLVWSSLDRQVSGAAQLQAFLLGILTALLGLGFGRLLVRSPLALLMVVALSGLAAVGVALVIYRHNRMQIARREIQASQLAIFHLEEQIHPE